jgi:hypothetical protein
LEFGSATLKKCFKNFLNVIPDKAYKSRGLNPPTKSYASAPSDKLKTLKRCPNNEAQCYVNVVLPQPVSLISKQGSF